MSAFRSLGKLPYREGAHMNNNKGTAFGRYTDELEETLIAIILAAMTILTFSNVVARYILNSNILWALEVTKILFAWLVLLGASYGVKKSIHIGVDILVKSVPPAVQRIFNLMAVTACLVFCAILLKGSWEYWVPYVTDRAWLETEDIPMPEYLQFLSTWMNGGERYEKVPVMIPYLILPIGTALLLFRYLQAAWQIITGEREMIIASHEAEDMMEELEKADPVISGKEKS